jgi:hypothetical protein
MILKGRAPVERETSIQYSIIIIISTYLHLYCMRSGMNGGREAYAPGVAVRMSELESREAVRRRRQFFAQFPCIVVTQVLYGLLAFKSYFTP